MAGKVWVVTSGEYSSYGIVAIFSTEDAATEFVRYHNVELYGGQPPYGEEYRVEVFALDAEYERDRDVVVFIGDDGGDIVVHEGRGPNAGLAGIWIDKYFIQIDEHSKPRRRFWGCGKSFEHARRAAEELRRQMLASER